MTSRSIKQTVRKSIKVITSPEALEVIKVIGTIVQALVIVQGLIKSRKKIGFHS
jgi:hypothetical protein